MRISPPQGVASLETRSHADSRVPKNDAKAPAVPQKRAEAPVPQTIREKAVAVRWENNVMVWRFTDKLTGDLIQQIPSDEVLKVFRTIQESLDPPRAQKLTIEL